jgi:hypothetical protein
MTYYTSAKPVRFRDIVDTEVERGNCTHDQANHWKKKYGIDDQDKAVWVSPKKWVANSYNLSSDEKATAEKIPENEMDIRSIPSSKGFIIKESDDGDDGYIFVFRKGIVAIRRASEDIPSENVKSVSEDRLQEILKTMNVPELRKTDYRWLFRNILVQNKNHPDLKEALDIIKEKIKGPVSSGELVARVVSNCLEIIENSSHNSIKSNQL